MAIVRTFNGASLREPGAYSKTTVSQAGGFPLAATGVIGIVGESDGGEGGATAGVQTYTSQDIAALITHYKSGPIVAAARALIAPAKDGKVPNGASMIRVYKTNPSTASTLALVNGDDDTSMTLTSANFGEGENLIQAKVTAGANTDARIVTLKKGILTETLSENACAATLVIQYTGSDASCTLEIKLSGGAKSIVLTPVTTEAEELTISLAGKTVQDVVDTINNFGGVAGDIYACTTTFSKASSTAASSLDWVSTATNIKTPALTLRRQQQEIADIINSESSLATAAITSEVEGTIAAFSTFRFLTGAARGASTNDLFQEGFDALLATRCNTVVPLVARDASEYITDGTTDTSSTWTVETINLQALTHCIIASNTQNRSERNTYVSLKASFADTQEAAQALNHERASMLFQDVDTGAGFVEPWVAACMMAGIQAGTEVGTPTTHKKINAIGIRHQDYNAKTQKALAIDAGLTPLEEKDSGGFRVVVGNTTYSDDANFVYNRASVLAAADYVAYNLRQQLEDIFVGNKGKTGTNVAIKNAVTAIMTSFLDADITVGDDTNENLGYKDLVVTVTGNTAYVDITVTVVEGIDWVLNRITLDSARASA